MKSGIGDYAESRGVASAVRGPPEYISYVVNVLNWYGCAGITPELLRAAKRSDVSGNSGSQATQTAAAALWRALDALTSHLYSVAPAHGAAAEPAEGGSRLLSSAAQQESRHSGSASHAEAELRPGSEGKGETQMRAVASDCRERLCARGYERPQFHAAGDADAREVLVALAWAMADGRAFDRYWGARLERCGLRCGDATREQDKQQTPTALPEWPLPYDVTDTPAALEEAAQAMLEELSATATAPPPHADALGRARHGVNAMLAQYGRLDALLRELEGLERGRARLIHKLQQISAQQQLDTTTDASRRERAPLPATPLGLCLAPLPRLQDAQAAHVTRLNATLRAAAAARPLERQWWKWVTAAAAAPAAAPLPPPPPLPGSAAAAAAVPTASAAPALPAAAAAASAAAAEGDELSGVQLTRGEERLLAALRGAAAAAAPVVRARLLQAAEPWGGLRELAGGSAQTMPAPAAAATAAATRALHSEAASIMAAATQAGLGSLLSAHDVHSAGPGTPPPEPPMAGQGAREWWGEGGEEGGEAALVLRRASAEAELRRTVERCERAMLHDANWL